ncbi:hypothetical protein ACROYT_G039817 [Oculina patagonica]
MARRTCFIPQQISESSLLTVLSFWSRILSEVHSNFGQGDPAGAVTCNNDHTVDITITDVDDLDEWVASDWQLKGEAACEPTFTDASTVTYSGLHLPDCALEQQQLADSVKYVLEVSVTKGDPGGAGQLRAYDHLYYVSCDYDNEGNVEANFIPIVNRGNNDTGNALFTLTLDVSTSDSSVVAPSNPMPLDVTLYFTAAVETQSSAPNLDLFPVSCWASSNSEPSSTDNRVTLITDGCGSAAVSEDNTNTLAYSCAADSLTETFSINSFRYFGAAAGDTVYFHCTLRVCLADLASADSDCECPADPAACPAKRKRRSVNNFVEEVNVRAGPYTFVDDTEKEEVESEKQDEPQSFSTNLAIIVAVSGVVVVAVIVCATVFLVVRNRNKRRQDRDLNVVT